MKYLDFQPNSQIEEVFPYIQDKAIFDFINGLSVADELNEVNKQRANLLIRIREGLSGQHRMRQDHINDHFINGLAACRDCFQELSNDIEKHGAALIRINNSLQKTQNNIEYLAQYISHFKQEFQQFAQYADRQFRDLQAEFNATKRLVLAEQQLNRLMDKWAAGKLNGLSPAARCYSVLDALYWGAFGERIRSDKDGKDFLEALENKLIIRLKTDMQTNNPKEGFLRKEWLALPENHDPQLQKALQYQSDWCLSSPDMAAEVFTVTQWPALNHKEQQQYSSVPFHIITSERLAKRMINNIFGEI